MKTVWILVLLAGCATVWYKPGSTQQQFYRDNSQCMAMAGSGNSQQIQNNWNPAFRGYNQGAAIGAAANQKAIYQQCMMGNGWSTKRGDDGW